VFANIKEKSRKALKLDADHNFGGCCSHYNRGIKEYPVTYAPHLKPLKLKKLNIGTEEKPKIASIGDY